MAKELINNKYGISIAAIQKAIDNGYKPDGIEDVTSMKVTTRGGQTWVRWFNDLGDEVIQDVEHVIYSHDFAKALWGEDTLSPNYGDLEMLNEPDYAWEHHLQHMVIADDPIEYLLDNL